MTLSTDAIFVTTEQEGFRYCRETRTSSTATMTVLYCTKGHIDVYYHGEMFRIKAGDLFVRIPDFCHQLGPYEMSKDFEFYQITIDAKIFERVMYDHMRIEPNWYIKQEYLKAHPTFKVNDTIREFFFAYFHMITLQLEDTPTMYRKEILMMIARGAAMEMLNYLDKLSIVKPEIKVRKSVNSGDYIFHEFTRLLQQYPHKREVQWYAVQMGITPKYLSEICKVRSGKAAGEWISDITISEIKHYLKDTTLSIHDIANLMEFPNASFFCQYTKKHTGMAPNQFRRGKHH